MADVGMLSKDKQLKDGARYNYLSEEKVTAEVHAAMVKHGLACVPVNMEIIENREDETAAGKAMHDTRIRATYRLIDPSDGDTLEVMGLGEGSDMGDKCLNKCMTAALKYAMRQTFMISTGDDPDHQAAHEAVASHSAVATPRPAAQQPRGGAQTGGGEYTTRDIMARLKELEWLEDDGKDGTKPTGHAFGEIGRLAGRKCKWSEFTQEELAAIVTGLDAQMVDPFANE